MTKNIIIYDTTTGEIRRSVSCHESAIAKQVHDGESVIVDCVISNENYVIEGAPVYIPPVVPEIPEPTLDEVKVLKEKEIKAAFTAAFSSGYTTQTLPQNIKIDCNRKDLDNIRGLIEWCTLNPQKTQVEFRGFDNDQHTISAADLTTIKNELIAYGLWLYQHKWELEAEIEAALTIEEVQAVAWSCPA